MQTRALGSQGLTVSALGLGCMGMTSTYGAADRGEAVATLHRAIEIGVTFFDTAEAYGPYENEKLIGHTIKGKRDKALFLNFLTDISPACDCYGHNDAPIVRNIGILAATELVSRRRVHVHPAERAERGRPVGDGRHRAARHVLRVEQLVPWNDHQAPHVRVRFADG